MNQDPRTILDTEAMGRLQVIVVGVCVLLTALDGFDVLSISFAAPGIADEWNISRATLGIVLSMELIGMSAGSIVLGSVADSFGRRPIIFICLTIMATGMIGASTANSIVALSLFRFFTGIGIGGMLASTNAMVAECANARHRSLAVTLMAAGYPLGVIIGGSISSELLIHFDWRAIFVFGACVTAIFIPVVWIWLPESIGFLIKQQPGGALMRVNATLRRMGHRTVAALPEKEVPGASRASVVQLFSPRLRRTTALLTLAYFAHIMTFYFMLKWIPKIVVDMGFEPSKAGGVLVWANVGGMCGAVLLGLLARRFGVRTLVITSLVLAFVLVSIFGAVPADLGSLALIAAVAGFFTNAAVVGFYALFVEAFPTEVRAGGTGFVIGMGRGGAALGPVIAGLLFASGQSLLVVAIMMGAGALIAATAIALLPGNE
ncbi:MAG TPA: MFS transporter [Woeseiaceae bacterium]|nr:MFS transporter [Woeseiaceae bacterium]